MAKTFLIAGAQTVAACWRRLTQPGHRRVVLYVSDLSTGSAADLRAASLALPLKARAWAALVPHPGLGLGGRRWLNWCFQPHAIVMQKARHPLNRPHLYPGVPCVVDIDDADMHDPGRTLIEHQVYADAAAVICGSRYIASQVRPHNPVISTVWTCTYIKHAKTKAPQAGREPVVCWAASDPAGYPMELAFVQQVVASLKAAGADFEFWIYGFKASDPMMQAFTAALTAAQVRHRTWSSMPYRSFVDSLASVAVGLNPVCEDNLFSRGKSFGKLLAYMAADVAIVGTATLDYPLFFEHGHSAMLLPNDPAAWAHHVARLLAEPRARAEIAQSARVQFEKRLDIGVAADRLAAVLDRVSPASHGRA